jgi:hypothetical protein
MGQYSIHALLIRQMLVTDRIDRVEISSKYCNTYTRNSPLEEVLERSQRLVDAYKISERARMVFYIAVAYFIWSLDITDEHTRKLAVLALRAVGDRPRILLDPNAVMRVFRRVGPNNGVDLVNALSVDRNMVGWKPSRRDLLIY